MCLSAAESLRRAQPLYAKAFSRWKNALPDHTEWKFLEADGRLVVGVGGESVLETGLTLEHTYGVPILPGTALKGVTSRYCRRCWFPSSSGGPEDELLRRSFSVLFGRESEGGLVIFHDAWPDPEWLIDGVGCLLADVLTSHHTDYYTKDNAEPSDFDDPNPVSFLSARGRFCVAVSSRSPSEPERWASLALELLIEAVATWGIGAKTNSGYGRLHGTGDG